MFKKIVAVYPVSSTELLAWFGEGEIRHFDVASLMNGDAEGFEILKDDTVFRSARISAEGYAISWGEGLELSCKEVYEQSEAVDIVSIEAHRVIAEAVEARHEAGFSQAKLAMAAGVKQPVVARLETAANSPRLDTIVKILAPLGKTIKVMDIEAAHEREWSLEDIDEAGIE